MTSAPAIGFEYLPSRSWRRVLLAIGLLAITACVLCGVAPWLKGLLILGCALLTFRAVRRWSNPAIAAVGWSGDSDWTLRFHDQTDAAAALLSFRVFAEFVLLRFGTQAYGSHVVLLLPDNSDADTRRRLRMRLATMQLDEALPRI